MKMNHCPVSDYFYRRFVIEPTIKSSDMMSRWLIMQQALTTRLFSSIAIDQLNIYFHFLICFSEVIYLLFHPVNLSLYGQ